MPNVATLRLTIDGSGASTGVSTFTQGTKQATAAANEARGATAGMQGQLTDLGATAKDTGGIFGELGGTIHEALALAGIGLGAKELVAYADDWANVGNQLRFVTDAGQSLAELQAKLVSLSEDTHTSLEGTVDTYKRFADASDRTHLSQQQLLEVVGTVNKAVALSGTSADEAQGAVNALARSFATGTVEGRVLITLLNQAPVLAEQLAKGLGITVAQFKALANTGAISSLDVANALQKQGIEVSGLYAQRVTTVAEAFTSLKTGLLAYIGQADGATGASDKLVAVIDGVAKHLDQIGTAAEVVGTVFAARAIAPMVEGLGVASAALVKTTTYNLAWNEALVTEAELQVAAATAVQVRAEKEVATMAAALAVQQEYTAAILAEEGSLTELAASQNFVIERTAALVTAQEAAIAASEAATAANAQLATAEAASGVAATVAAAGVGVLDTAVAAVGGPIGLIIIAVGLLVTHLHDVGNALTSLGALADKLPTWLKIPLEPLIVPVKLLGDLMGDAGDKAETAAPKVAHLAAAFDPLAKIDLGQTGQKLQELQGDADALYKALSTGGLQAYQAAQLEASARQKARDAWTQYAQTLDDAKAKTTDFDTALAGGNGVSAQTVAAAKQIQAALANVNTTQAKTVALQKALTEGAQAKATADEALLGREALLLTQAGDYAGAQAKVLAADSAAIDAKYKKLVVDGALSKAAAQEAADAEKAVAADKARVTTLTAVYAAENALQALVDKGAGLTASLTQTQVDAAGTQLTIAHRQEQDQLTQQLNLKAITQEQYDQRDAQLLINQGLEDEAQARAKAKQAASEQQEIEAAVYQGAQLSLTLQGKTYQAAQEALDQTYKQAKADLDARLASGDLEKATYDRLTAQLAVNKGLEGEQLQWKALADTIHGALADAAGDVDTFFTNFLTEGTDAFKQLASDLLSTVEKLAAKLAEVGLLKALLGGDQSGKSEDDLLNELSSKVTDFAKTLTSKLGKGATGSIAGAAAGIGVGLSTGSAGLGALSGAATGAALGGPVGAVIGGVTGLISGLFGASEKMKQLQAQYEANIATFDTSLTTWVDSIGAAADSIKTQLVANITQTKTATDQAFALFASSGAAQKSIQQGLPIDKILKSVFDTDGLAGLQKFAEHSTGAAKDSVVELINELTQIGSASSAAADAIKQGLIDRITSEFDQSQGPIGQALDSINAIVKQKTQDLADAGEAGLKNLDPQILATATNSLTTLFKGLSESDLATLVPTLSGDMQALAQSILDADQAADAAKQAGITTDLTVRQAQDANDPTAAAQAKAAADAKEYAQDVTDGWSAANLALLQQIQTAEEATVAAQALADAQAKAAADAKTSRDFDANLQLRAAQLSGNADAIKAANLQQLANAQEDELNSAKALVTQGVLTQAQYDALAGVLGNEMQSAIDSTTGSVTDLATAAQILSDNVSQLDQQFDVMGTGLDDQVDQLGKLYGLQGKSITDLQALYTKVTPGSELTDAQSTLNAEIAKLIDLKRQAADADTQAAADSAQAATDTSRTAAATAPTGNVFNGNVAVEITINTTAKDLADPDRAAEAIAARVDRILGGKLSLQRKASGASALTL